MSRACVVGLCLFFVAGTSGQQPEMPQVGLDDAGNLHVNSTATTRVFVDGVDVVGLSSEVSSLRRQVQALIDALPSIPPSDSPTAEPTPVPSDAPSTLAPSTAPSGSPTVTAVVHTGDVQLGAGCAFSSAYYTSLNVITGEWTMNGCQNAVTLDIAPFGGWFGSFMNLERIDKQLKIYGNYNLATLGAAFSSLVQLGAGLPAGAPALLIEVNPLLRTLGTAFAALRRISGTLSIHNNRLSSHHPNVLTNFEALRNLECHGGVYQDNLANCQGCPIWLIALPRCQ